jgi:hypothetical protein
MDDQNRLRLGRITARHAKRSVQARSGAESESEIDAAFLAAFGRLRDEVLRPVMAEVGVQLKGAGYDFRISPGGEEGAPSVDFHVRIADRGDSKDTIRFFARKDAERGWQVIGELDLRRSPIELTRFETPEEISRDVAEQLVVDAVEQMFASTGGAPPDEPVQAAPAPGPAAPPPAPARREARARHAVEARVGAPDAPAEESTGATSEVDVSMFRRAALPFTKGAPAPPFFETADAARAEVRAPRASATGHTTMVLPVMDVATPTSKCGADGRHTGERACASLTVEQYAAFCAEVAVFPDHVVQVHQRYGVGQDARTALDEAFAQRFTADPTLQRRWRALVAHYGDWYREHAHG